MSEPLLAVRGVKSFYGHIMARASFADERLSPYPFIDTLACAGMIVGHDGRRFTDEGKGGGGGGTCGGQLIWFTDQLQREGGGSNHEIAGRCVTRVPHVKRFRARRTTRIQSFGSDQGRVLINAQIGCPLPAG